MRMLAATVACAASARARTHTPPPQSYVGVGTQGLVFTPATVSAPVNHEVHFVIANTAASPNITVIQSKSPEEPCTPLPGGIRSASRGVDQPDLSIVVQDSSPIYLHAEPYCQRGMVFILNPAQDTDIGTFSARARASASLGVAIETPDPDASVQDEDASELLPLPSSYASNTAFATIPLVTPMMFPQSMALSTASGGQSGGFIQEDPSFPPATTCSTVSHSISAATLGAAIIAAIAGTLSIVFLVVLLFRVRASRQAVEPHTQMVEPRNGASPSPVAGSSHTANGAIVSQFLDMSDDNSSTLGRTRGRSWVRHLRKSATAAPPSPV